ncbi:MAG: Lrp/AsnC family transcriptional regulator [Halioglobus sp.]
MNFDRIDRQILSLVQRDSRLTHQEIADRIGSSTSSVSRRIQALEEGGVIFARVALVNPSAVGLNVSVICNVKLTHHSDDTRIEFESLVDDIPEIVSCYAVSGSHDYTLTVVVSDVQAYADFLNQRILNSHLVDAASSSFTLRTVKNTTELHF